MTPFKLNKAQNLGRIFVVDLEATCWHNPETGSKQPPEGQECDIIEIGFCLLRAKDYSITKPQRLFVQPERSEISKFCYELTGITPTMLRKQGMPLKEASRRLREKHGSSSRTWASWGDGDLTMLSGQCQRDNVPYPFSATHHNVQILFSLVHGLKDVPNLEAALAKYGMDFVGQPHNGGDDAFNTGRLLSKLLWDVEPAIREIK